MRSLIVAIVFALVPLPAQAQSVEGAWELTEAGPEGGPLSPVQGGLAIYTATHFSFILDLAPEPRPSMTPATFSSGSGDDFRALLQFFNAQAGTYEVNGKEFTSRPLVQIYGPATAEAYAVTEFSLEGDRLSFTTRRTNAGPIPNPQTLVFRRVR